MIVLLIIIKSKMLFIFDQDQNVKFFISRHVYFKVKTIMKTTHIERVNVLNIHQHDPKDKKTSFKPNEYSEV